MYKARQKLIFNSGREWCGVGCESWRHLAHVKRKGIVTFNYSISCGLLGSFVMSYTTDERLLAVI